MMLQFRGSDATCTLESLLCRECSVLQLLEARRHPLRSPAPVQDRKQERYSTAELCTSFALGRCRFGETCRCGLLPAGTAPTLLPLPRLAR